MKKTLIYLLILILFQQLNSQSFYASNEHLKTLDGSTVHVNEIFTSLKGTILIFWETNNPSCCNNLDNLQDAWVKDVKALGVNLVTICVNCSGMPTKVKPYVSGKGWDFETYIDTNGDLKRALGITTTPYTILLDGNQNIKCRYPGYCSGDETQICNKIIHCLENTESLSELK